MLPGNETDPSRQVASGRERFPVADLCDQGGGDNRANAGDLLEPPALLTRSVPSMDALLDRSNLCRDGYVLASKNFETKSRCCWNAIILSISKHLEQLNRSVAALGRDDAKLGHVPTDRVRQHRSLTNQKLPAAMQHQTRLLLFGLNGYETHRRPRHRFTDGRSIIGVVLAPLEIRLDVTRRHQPYRVAKPLKLTAPMMCTRASLDTDQTERQSGKEIQHLCTRHTFADHYRAINTDTVDLEYRLRDIKTNCANLTHGRLPS